MASSKNMYQGVSMRRAKRSELDDSTLRDHARQSNRLSEDLRTVDRAKQVMLKSHDADKQMFIKAGHNKPKMSMSAAQKNDPRNRIQPQQPPRLVQDSRTKRGSVTEPPMEDNHTKRSSVSSLHVTSPLSNARTSDKSAKVFQGLSISAYTSCSLYDDLLTGKSGADNSPSSAETNAKNVKFDDAYDNKSVAKDFGLTVTSNNNGKASDPGSNFRKVSHYEDDVLGANLRNKSPEFSNDKAHVPMKKTIVKDEDQSRKSNVWDKLSQPKNASTSRDKRRQIQREFTSGDLTTGKAANGKR